MSQVGVRFGFPSRAHHAAPQAGAVPGADGGPVLDRETGPLLRPTLRRNPAVSYLTGGVLAALSGAAIFLVLTEGGGVARPMAPLVPELDEFADLAGFGIGQVTVTGQRFTPDADVFDALELDKSRTLASFDSAAARARIEALPWIKSAVIRRVYPGELAVTLTEREAFAVWQRPEGPILIDADGRLLSAPGSADAWDGLLVVAGDGAAGEAKALMALVSSSSLVSGRLRRASRVAGRRWSLALADDVRIELPAIGASAALLRLAEWSGAADALAVPGTVLDLRSADRIHVRTATGSGVSVAPTVAPAGPSPDAIANLIGRSG